MLKHHPKLKREWFLSYSVLSRIAGKLILTKGFEKELSKIVKKETYETLSRYAGKGKKELFFPLGRN